MDSIANAKGNREMIKYVVREVEFGGDVDGTGPERWLGMMLQVCDTREEAEAYIERCIHWAEVSEEEVAE
jgi:hypothetical protein